MATTSPEMDKATCNKKELVLELTKGVSNVQCPHRDRERRVGGPGASGQAGWEGERRRDGKEIQRTTLKHKHG